MGEGNALTLGVIFSIVAVIFTFIFFLLRGTSKRRNTVLLMGPCDAGKSLMFLRLVHKQFAMTCTSVKDNKGHFIAKIKDKILTMVDIPGHERLRAQYLDEYGASALGVVFVVDSSTISRKTVADVAEFLFSILTDPVVFKSSEGPNRLQQTGPRHGQATYRRQVDVGDGNQHVEKDAIRCLGVDE